MISVLAAVLSITVGAALARGFRSVLRRRLKSQDGLSLEDYDALVNFADGNLHYRFRFVAIAVFAVFFISQLMGPATQAAFGQSPSTQQKTYVFDIHLSATVLTFPLHSDAFNLTRLVDNLTYATESLEVSVNSFPAADIDKSATQAMLSIPTRFSAGTDNFSTQVFDTTEISTHGVPLFEASLPQERLARFENTTGSAGDAADVVISTPAEAFYATIVCSNVTSTLPSTIEVSNKTLAVEIEPRCGAGNRTFIWRRDLIFIGDTHACDGVDGPLVYVLQANTTGGVLRSVFECTVSASSAVLPVVVVPRNNSAYITGSPVNRSDIPSSFPLGAYLGEDLLNSFGSSGWLAFTRVIGGANVGLDQQKLAEILVETVAKIELTHAQYFVSASLEANSSVQAAKVSIPFLSSFLSTVLTGTLPMCSTNSPPSRSTFTAGNSPGSSSPPSFSSSSSPSPPSSSPMGLTPTTPPTPSSPPSSGFLRRRTGGSARLGMSRSREGRGFGSRKCWAGREVEPLTRSVC